MRKTWMVITLVFAFLCAFIGQAYFIQQSAYAQGLANGHKDGYQQGYTAGYIDGKTAGMASGYKQGYDAGKTAGYTQGSTDGKNNGYQQGYSDGYTAGKQAELQIIRSWLQQTCSQYYNPGYYLFKIITEPDGTLQYTCLINTY